jgi:hypothetical protein
MRRALFVAGLVCMTGLRPAAQAGTDSAVHVALRVAGGRVSFTSGEPIRLQLVVTADRPGYVIDTDGPDNATDDVSVTPANGTRIVASPRWSDVSAIGPLSATPVVVPLTLNYWVRFDRSGDYTVRVTTRRVFEKDPHDWTPARSRPPLTLTSGDVIFHVDVLDETREQYLVGPALAHIDASASADFAEQVRAAEELAFLPGDAAALAKYHAFRDLDARVLANTRSVIERGFVVSRRPLLILEQFERELSDVNRALPADAISEATRLRAIVEHPELIARLSPPVPNDLTEPWLSIKRRYLDDALASLPARSGRNRMETAMALLRVSMPPPATALDIVLDGFGQLPIADRYDLIISVLHDVRDPRLTTGLSRSVAEAGPEYIGPLIEALVARDPAAAIAPVMAALRDPGVILLKSSFENFPANQLVAAGPGIVLALETLAASPKASNSFRIEQKAEALELVADGSVVPDVQAFYDANQARLSRPARAHLLAYLARWDSKNGAAFLRKAVMADGRLIDQLSRSRDLPGFDQLCRERLFDADTDIAVTSAVALRAVGVSSDRSLIEQRLAQWREMFRSRAAAAETATDGYTEEALFTAATEGREWRLTGADWDRVHAGCVTDRCRALKR